MKLDEVLRTLDTVVEIAKYFPPAAAGAQLADVLLAIAIKTNNAHQALYGKPLDYTLLKPYVPVPLETPNPTPPPGT